jgi:hypothetical protein
VEIGLAVAIVYATQLPKELIVVLGTAFVYFGKEIVQLIKGRNVQ